MQKTIMPAVLAMLLFIFAAPAAFAGETTPIKVGLKYASGAQLSYTIVSEDGFYIAESTGSGWEEIEHIADYGKVIVTSAGTEIRLQTPDGSDLFDDLSGYVLLSAAYAEGDPINLDGSAYRGGLCFTQNSDGTMNAINILDVEQYIYGVLNGEMHHKYPQEALKAQAITARSFALTNLNRHAAYGFDVCSGTHCQVYKGYSDEYKETTAATDDTAGLVMYAGSKIVCGYYSKNSGGHTQDSSDVWGGNVAYLKGVPDPYSPAYPWTVSFTFQELENMLDAARKPVGKLKKVMITERNAAGAVSELQFEGTAGSAVFTKEIVRTFFGAGLVKSTMFSFTGAEVEDDSGDEDAGAAGEFFVSNGRSKQAMPANVAVIGGNNKSVQVKSSNAYASNGTVKVKMSTASEQKQTEAKKPSNAEVVTEGPLVISGMGFGHGVGMPQDSAIEMAKQGFTFDDILKYYYTGIEIR